MEKLRKACAVSLIASATIWLTISLLAFGFGLETHSALGNGEGFGFIFAVIFLALFSVLGIGVGIMALVFFAVDVICLIALSRIGENGKKGIIAIGIVSLLFGSPISGIMLLIAGARCEG